MVADRVAIAKRWIERGYKATLVLNAVGIAPSTYYYCVKETKSKSETKPRGREIPGYSLNKNGEKVTDEQIKNDIIELVTGDGFPYGYRKITACLKEDIIINHKKVYRLCKELDVLRPQRKIHHNRPRKLAQRKEITGPNQQWQMDVKYGYIVGTGRFFFQLSLIDVFDKSIIDYHLGLSAKAKDACAVLVNSLRKRGLSPRGKLPVVRTDNGPQFTAKIFEETCRRWNLNHERIPVKTPNMNAYIESFHSILEDDCYSRNEFSGFPEAYKVISDYIMDYYNNRRRHGSINYMAPNKFYLAFINKQVTGFKLVA